MPGQPQATHAARDRGEGFSSTRTYHLGPIRIVWYLERYHGIKISDAGVYRILRRHGLNRLPSRVGRRAVHTHRYVKQVPGHPVQADVRFLKLRGKAGELTRRLVGNDPAHGGEAARRRGKRNAVVLRANVAWESRQTEFFDPATFAREIKPKLQGVSLAAMMRATGLSRPYYAMIRRGARVPHARHWAALRVLLK